VSATEEKPAPDWERIEAEYRAGVLSLREIAQPFKVSHVAIAKKAKTLGWERDLGAKIQAKAEALVNKRLVTSEVNAARAVSEREIIEANAERIAQVRGEHRSDINRLRTLGLSLLGELEGQSAKLEDLEALGELLRSENEAGVDRLNDLYHKIISTPGRVDSAKKVAETLKHAIGLEREAYGLDPKKGDGDKPDGVISGSVSYRANIPARG
jgi:hypothetical protein